MQTMKPTTPKNLPYQILADAYRKAYDYHEKLHAENESLVKRMLRAQTDLNELGAAIEKLGYEQGQAYEDGTEC